MRSRLSNRWALVFSFIWRLCNCLWRLEYLLRTKKIYIKAKARTNTAATPTPIAAFTPTLRPPPSTGVGEGEGLFVVDVEVADADTSGPLTPGEVFDTVIVLDAVVRNEDANVVEAAHVFEGPEVDIKVKFPLSSVIASSSPAPNGPDSQNQQRVGNYAMWPVIAQ
jgi:hypothetical protein